MSVLCAGEGSNLREQEISKDAGSAGQRDSTDGLSVFTQHTHRVLAPAANNSTFLAFHVGPDTRCFKGRYQQTHPCSTKLISGPSESPTP